MKHRLQVLRGQWHCACGWRFSGSSKAGTVGPLAQQVREALIRQAHDEHKRAQQLPNGGKP